MASLAVGLDGLPIIDSSSKWIFLVCFLEGSTIYGAWERGIVASRFISELGAVLPLKTGGKRLKSGNLGHPSQAALPHPAPFRRSPGRNTDRAPMQAPTTLIFLPDRATRLTMHQPRGSLYTGAFFAAGPTLQDFSCRSPPFIAPGLPVHSPGTKKGSLCTPADNSTGASPSRRGLSVGD